MIPRFEPGRTSRSPRATALAVTSLLLAAIAVPVSAAAGAAGVATPTATPTATTSTPAPSASPTDPLVPEPSPTGSPTPTPTSTPTPTQSPEPEQTWDVDNGYVNDAAATVLNDGHIDVASLLDGGALTTRIKDTSMSAEPVWRDTAETILQLTPDSRTSVPAAPAYSFLGEAGADLWQLAHVQQPGLLWPGWSTEAIAPTATEGGVTWALTAVDGPGDFVLFAPSATTLGGVDLLMSSRDGIDDADRVVIPRQTHAHGSWAFTAEGHYCLRMDRATRLASGAASTHSFTLAVAVGTADVAALDPAECADDGSGHGGETPVPVPPPPPGGDEAAGSVPASQDLAPAHCVAAGTVLSAGHIDYASRFVDGRLQSLIGDDTSGSKVYREPGSVVLWLKPSARVALPAGYDAVGPAGTAVWQVPQSQNRDLVWLGWNTEALHPGNAQGAVAWSLDTVEGPGSVHVYLAGVFGGVHTMVLNGAGSRYEIPPGVHAHANWAFSAQGVYRLTTTQTVTHADGRSSSDTETLTIAVGDVDPVSAFPAGGCGAVAAGVVVTDDGMALAPESQSVAEAAHSRAIADDGVRRGADEGQTTATAHTGDGPAPMVPVLLSALGASLILAAAGLLVLSRQRRGTS